MSTVIYGYKITAAILLILLINMGWRLIDGYPVARLKAEVAG